MSAIEAAFFGSLGRDAEQRASKPGRPYLLLNVRVGEGDGAQWVNVRCFDKDAVEIADKFVKGARVYVEGKLSLSEWTNADGMVKTGLSVMSWYCRLAQIGRQKMRDGVKPKEKGSGAAGSTFYDDRIPFSPEVR